MMKKLMQALSVLTGRSIEPGEVWAFLKIDGLELFLSAALLMLLERVCLTPELQPINPNFRQS